MHTMWRGLMTLGVASIPVRLGKAVDEVEHLRLLNRQTGNPIKLERRDSITDDIVELDDVVKGIQTGKDKFAIIDPEQIAELKMVNPKVIDLSVTLSRARFDLRHCRNHYYLAPDGVTDTATRLYTSFAKALYNTELVAIGTMVLAAIDTPVAVTSINGTHMDLVTLTSGTFVRQRDDIAQIDDAPLTEAAVTVLQGARDDDFDLTTVKSVYYERLQQLRDHYIAQEDEKEDTAAPFADALLDVLRTSMNVRKAHDDQF